MEADARRFCFSRMTQPVDPKSTIIEDNIRIPLVDDPQLLKALKLSSERIALRNRFRTEGGPTH